MPNSLRNQISKLRYKGKITQEECDELLSKLTGHDAEIKANERRKFAEWIANNKKYNPMKCEVGIVWSDGIHFSTVDKILAEYEKEQKEEYEINIGRNNGH